ncbi:hypothetical protein ASC95_08665 [Pelomonas sp. Root1217]|uniref:hypothetical protein n=1 Tax=Pelomonas sp. Root1217 TaxID=1736430 RepID=UPI0007162069|nr:hypothetical protein [Pelomonas sp. Root1217]KQV52861.1 hypothetical protein ASC95_08665 [Pelomonas sp. Root1217]
METDASWRAQWEIREDSKPLPTAWHRCGWCIQFEYDAIDNAGTPGWVLFDAEISESRVLELSEEMGEEAFRAFWRELHRQARALWGELGYTNDSSRRAPALSADDWRQQWVLDVDENALAQAVHSSGLGIAVFTVKDEEDRHIWCSMVSDDFGDERRRLKLGLGPEASAALETRLCMEALQLWHEWGHKDDDPFSAERAYGSLPCKVVSWRSQWKVGEDEGLGLPDALHANGLAISYVYTEIGEDEMGWVAKTPTAFEAREAELRAELGASAVHRLYKEARNLWAELGYFDHSPVKL